MILQASGLSLPGRLFDASLEIAEGELVGLVGPNGSGKTSLLHALAGIGGARSGKVALDGIDPRILGPAERPAYLTYLPATRDVPWPLVARDLIALGGGDGVDGLELEALLARRIDTLSTGERSRVLIARALAPRPKLLLLDEPTANLDPLWQIRLMELVRGELKGGGRAALVALHDLDAAARYADRILVMNEGRIAAEGLEGPHIATIFGVERVNGDWEAVRPPADRRSSP
ncbi:MAG TPA: ABC transporter ATP-binding protein [Allosphingosinicella sp.]|nr:ABC transporter ATP-binding protein [Allosphingosinicella sp.]